MSVDSYKYLGLVAHFRFQSVFCVICNATHNNSVQVHQQQSRMHAVTSSAGQQS